jgi:IS5 family transposase
MIDQKQLTLAAGVGFERYRKPTRRELFLAEMNRVVPWSELVALIEPHYPKRTKAGGRPPVGIERMLRMHFVQHWFNLSDPAVEEALYESASMRAFVGIDLGVEPVPDETTVLRFRHLLENNGLGARIFEEVGRILQSRGLKVSSGTIVDATIIAAPSSTKNVTQTRDPEMRQTRKGKTWHFGMKAHIGVDERTRLIHSVVATSANVSDSKMLPALLHGAERRVWGDQGYRGQSAVIAKRAPCAQDLTNRRYRHRGVVNEAIHEANRHNNRIRARVEHAFGVLKGVFGFVKVRYRGLAKNGNRLFVACALANLFMARRTLMGAVRA